MFHDQLRVKICNLQFSSFFQLLILLCNVLSLNLKCRDVLEHSMKPGSVLSFYSYPGGEFPLLRSTCLYTNMERAHLAHFFMQSEGISFVPNSLSLFVNPLWNLNAHIITNFCNMYLCTQKSSGHIFKIISQESCMNDNLSEPRFEQSKLPPLKTLLLASASCYRDRCISTWCLII